VLQRTKTKPPKGQYDYERMARMPRNQLLDPLFALFRERGQWPIKLLREKTQQPEVYLKEVLSEIVTLHRSGEFNGTWELMPSFQGDGVRWLFFIMIGCTSNADVSVDDDEEEDEDDMVPWRRSPCLQGRQFHSGSCGCVPLISPKMTHATRPTP